ncbi:MAG: alpha/beta hydrolase [Pseudomonadales bacterium]|nr:alpha/beta hydrolase [Pseudomonadales bacterium]
MVTNVIAGGSDAAAKPRVKTVNTSLGPIAYYDIGEGQPVVLLHGFPDTPSTFFLLASELVDHGYRCIIPYMPGYGASALPNTQGVGKMADASVLGIGQMLDKFLCTIFTDENIKIIGHDWGSIVAQVLVALVDEYPQTNYRIDSAVFYAVPPLGSFYQNINVKQIIRSRYMFYFQLFGVTNTLRRDDLIYIKKLWARWSPWTDIELDSQPQLNLTLKTLAAGRCLENAIAYYRHFLNPYYVLRGNSLKAQNKLLLKKRECRSLLLVGEKDSCIGAEMFEGAESYYPHPDTRLEVMSGLGHFAHLENPARVNGVIKAFFQIKNPAPKS